MQHGLRLPAVALTLHPDIPVLGRDRAKRRR